MKTHLLKAFNIFLIIYFIFLLTHAVHEISIYLFLGIIVAIFAHAKKNLITLFLLLGHMSIEWLEWGHNLDNIILGLLIFNIIHAVMDFVFLNHEIRAHIKKVNSYAILIFVFIGLVSIAAISPMISINESILEPLHGFVLGGVIGCVGSHIIFHLQREKREKSNK